MAIYLPRDLWHQILCKLEEDDLESVSLVCKDFSLISNSLRRRMSFKVTYNSIRILPKLLNRFPALQEISLTIDNGASKNYCRATMHSAVYKIARSRLDIRFLNVSCPCDYGSLVKCTKCQGPSMENLQTLILSVCEIFDHNLQQIGKSFPSLKQVIIRKRCYDHSRTAGISEDAVELLTSKLKHLEKIVLPSYPSDKFVIALSSNCCLLKEIPIHESIELDGPYLGEFLRDVPDIIPFSVPYLEEICYINLKEAFSVTGENPIACAKKLQQINIARLEIRKNHDIFWVIITCDIMQEARE